MLFIVQLRPVAVVVGVGINGENDIGDLVIGSIEIVMAHAALVIAHVAFGGAGGIQRRVPCAVCVAVRRAGGKDVRVVTFDQAALGAGIIVNGCARAGGGGFQRIVVHRLGREIMHRVFHITADRAGADMVGTAYAFIPAVGVLLRFVIARDGEIGRDVCKRRIPRTEPVIMDAGVIGFDQVFAHSRRRGIFAVKHRLRINGIAVAVFEGNRILRFELQTDIDCIRAHRTGKRAFRNPDVRLAGSSLDIADLIGIFKIDRLPEIIHVVRHEIAVHVHIERTVAADAAGAGTTVQPAVDVQIILIAGPVQTVNGFVMDAAHVVQLLCDDVLIRRRGTAQIYNGAPADGLAGVLHVVPVARGKARAAGIGRIEPGVVIAVHIGVGAGGIVLEPEQEMEQIAVPGKDGIIIGGAADLHAPGVFAVIAREAGGILEIAVRDRRALQSAHGKAVIVIHVVAYIAAVSDDGEGSFASHLAGVIGIGNIIWSSAVLDLTDQTAVVTAAGNRAPVKAIRHVRIAVGGTALVAGLPGNTAVRAVVIVIICSDRAGVEAASDIGMMIGAPENTARVVIRLYGADVPALFDGGLTFVAVAENTAGGVAGGSNFTAVAAIIKLMIRVLPVAENAADAVFTGYVSVIVAVIEFLNVVFHVAADTARVIVRAAHVAVVRIVSPNARADIGTDDTAGVLSAVNVAAVDVVFNAVLGVRIHHTCDAARGLCSGFDISGVGAAGERHFLILALGAEVAENTARAGVRAHLAGVGTVHKGGLVILDPARDTAGVGIARIDLARIGAAVRYHTALGMTDQTGGAVMIGINQGPVGAVGEAKRIVRTVFADQTADVVIAINGTAVNMHVLESQISFSQTDDNGKAVFAVIVVIIDENVYKIHVFERSVARGTEQTDPVIAVVHAEVINGMPLPVEGALKVIIAAVIDVFAAVDIAEVDIVQVNIHVKINRLPAVRGSRAAVVDELRKSPCGRDMVARKSAAVPVAVPYVGGVCLQHRHKARQRPKGQQKHKREHNAKDFCAQAAFCFHKKPSFFMYLEYYIIINIKNQQINKFLYIFYIKNERA